MAGDMAQQPFVICEKLLDARRSPFPWYASSRRITRSSPARRAGTCFSSPKTDIPIVVLSDGSEKSLIPFSRKIPDTPPKDLG